MLSLVLSEVNNPVNSIKINDLPDDILCNISSMLPPKTFINFISTSRNINDSSKNFPYLKEIKAVVTSADNNFKATVENALIEKDNIAIDVLFNVALKMSNDGNTALKSVMLSKMSKYFIGEGTIDKALKSAREIPMDIIRNGNLRYISKYFGAKGDAEKALEIAREICNETTRSFCLKELSDYFKAEGDTDKALEIAREIPTHMVDLINFSYAVNGQYF